MDPQPSTFHKTPATEKLKENAELFFLTKNCLYFLPEVMVTFMRKAKGNLVMLIEISMYLIEHICGHDSKFLTLPVKDLRNKGPLLVLVVIYCAMS